MQSSKILIKIMYFILLLLSAVNFLSFTNSVNNQLIIFFSLYYLHRRILYHKIITFKYSALIIYIIVIIIIGLSFKKLMHTVKYYNYLMLGLINYNNENYQTAAEAYKKSMLYKQNDFKIYYNIGLAYFQLKDFDNALEYFEKSSKINPYFYDGLLMQAKSNIAINQNIEAIKVLEKIKSHNSHIAETYYLLGGCYFQINNLPESKSNFKKALELYNTDPQMQIKIQNIINKL